ncbi:helix-turn-helix domain-containing protein [Clostridium gasigenes]|uniref:Helix-turn-helix transcriptional regulator n=1 Tax=Clostridium gasigenes TaxID=94869 RepID=A0A7X0SH73_9CLOT|nr:helix-turn-helix transcriptional regulator [Clostridium gasigenes]MBB6716332.1 helix-turn-helix transcriptional regulator [Clostridium gasigenes]
MSTEQKELIGNVISHNRSKRKMTQQQLAGKSNLSRSYIADIEAGRYAPSVKSLVSIANVLNLDLNFLLKLTEIHRIDKSE